VGDAWEDVRSKWYRTVLATERLEVCKKVSTKFSKSGSEARYLWARKFASRELDFEVLSSVLLSKVYTIGMYIVSMLDRGASIWLAIVE